MTLFLSNECKKFLQNPSDDYRFCLEDLSGERDYTLTVYKKGDVAASDKKIYDLHTIFIKVSFLTFNDDKDTEQAFYRELSRRNSLYRAKLLARPYENRSVFQDVPGDVCKVIASKLSPKNALRFLSTSKRTYTINCLSTDRVSKIVSQYYTVPEKERKPSHIVNQVLRSKDFPFKLYIDIQDIYNVSRVLLNDSISITVSVRRDMPIGKHLSIVNTLDDRIRTKIKALTLSDVKCTAQDLIALLEKCPDLEELDIRGCKNIADLDFSNSTLIATKIKTIKAKYSSLTSQGLIALLEKCPDLEELDINDCKNIADLDFSNFTLISTKIKKIMAYSLSLTSQGLIALLEQCPDLEELNLEICKNIADLDFSNSTLIATKIKKIMAYSLSITSRGLIALLEKCPDLEELNLEICKNIADLNFSNSTLIATKIKKIYGYHLFTSQGLIALLEKCPDLEELDIRGCKNIADLDFSNSTLIATKIKTIKAKYSSLTSQGLIALLEKCPDLEELDINDCKNIADLDLSNSTLISTKIKTIKTDDLSLTSQGLITLLEQCPDLEELDIRGCKNITDLDLSNSTLIATKIKKIIAHGSSITSQGLIALLEKCPDLEEIHISSCRNIADIDLFNATLISTKIKTIEGYNLFTSQGLIALLKKCPDLEELDINNCKNIADLDLSNSTLISTKIKNIDAHCSSITSQSLIALLEKCPDLEKLNISFCKNIADLDLSNSTLRVTKIKKILASYSSLTSQDLIALLEKCPDLEELDISYCKNITRLNLNSLDRTKIKISDAGLEYGLMEKVIEQMRNLSITKKISNCCNIL